MITFRFNPRKTQEALERMLATAGEAVDFHTLLKAVYFADKQMLNEHGRPIFGASYRAMNYGPVPLEVYEMLKCEPYWLTELSIEEYPWDRVGGYRVKLRLPTNQPATPEELALSEVKILDRAFLSSQGMNFDQRTRETHGMDWVEGTRRSGGRMAYEDMIDPDMPQRDELIEELRVMGPRLEL